MKIINDVAKWSANFENILSKVKKIHYLCRAHNKLSARKYCYMKTSIKQLIAILLLQVLALVSSYYVMAAVGDDEAYKRWSDLPSEQLMTMGYDYHHKNVLDSASVCFAIVADRAYTKNLSKEEYSSITDAMIDLGYIYGKFYNDYVTGLEKFQEAYTLAQEHGLNEAYPHIFLNSGGIYLECMKIHGGTVFADEVWENSEAAYNYAIQEKFYEVALAAYLNVMLLPFEDNSWNRLKEWAEKFNNTNFPPNTTLYAFTKDVSDAMQAYASGNYSKALELLNSAGENEGEMPELRYYIDEIRARVYMAMGNDELALGTLISMAERAEKEDRHSEMTKAYLALYRHYSAAGDAKNAEAYLLKYYKQKDTFLTASKLSTLSKMNLLLKLKQANDQARIEQVRRSNSERLILVLLIAAVLAIGVIIYMIYARRKQHKLVVSLYRKNLELLRQEEETQELRHKFDREKKAQISSQGAAIADIAEMDSAVEDDGEETGESRGDVESREKDDNISLTNSAKEELAGRIRDCMENTELICDSDFSLQKLAECVNASYRTCSQVINEVLGKTFKTLLNEYRIREACRRFDDTGHYGHLTIEAISKSVGFNSRSNFVVTFKRVTGISPSEFASASHSKPGK